MLHLFRKRILVILIMIFSSNTLVLPLWSEPQVANNGTLRNNSPIEVMQADSKPYGLTYEDWTARWWQWAYSIPKDVNHAYDDTGKYCMEGQGGPVWFFAGPL